MADGRVGDGRVHQFSDEGRMHQFLHAKKSHGKGTDTQKDISTTRGWAKFGEFGKGVELPWGVSVNNGGILSYFNKHSLTSS